MKVLIHNGNKYRKLKARLRAEGRECGICHRPIDYSLPAGHPWSFELDHIEPKGLGGDVYAYDNCQASHRWCNQHKGKKRNYQIKNGEQAKKQVNEVKPCSSW